MPHLTIEYSANLDMRTDMQTLCLSLHRALLESRLFELGAVRVRALRAEHYVIADRAPDNAFADIRLRLGQGRTALERKHLGDRLIEVAALHFADLLARPHFALSLEVVEIDGTFSWKNNSIHPRLRAADKG